VANTAAPLESFPQFAFGGRAGISQNPLTLPTRLSEVRRNRTTCPLPILFAVDQRSHNLHHQQAIRDEGASSRTLTGPSAASPLGTRSGRSRNGIGSAAVRQAASPRLGGTDVALRAPHHSNPPRGATVSGADHTIQINAAAQTLGTPDVSHLGRRIIAVRASVTGHASFPWINT
jgi:hypothetical protein